ncbi:uncharacterized protein LOC130649399 [Hydractinia symbiolongicarpus]|uniref:uncharacterized protein LOC130649399 n=1 Tax=Hydractinia symbiolongicarpus TaxID=13093 RepID=UPI00254BB13D|nr:uncharacterized protein LOC130649399 [Hydractinia symbiolongicarpus]
MLLCTVLLMYVVNTVHSQLLRGFPINEFMNATEFSKNYPFYRLLCNGLKAIGEPQCCECDKDCIKYRTCCIDKLWDSEKPLPLQPYLSKFIEETKKHKEISCEPVLNHTQHKSETFLMVTSCLPGANQSDVNGCISPGIEINNYSPIVDESLYLYRNEYCARCNFITNFKRLDIKARCINASIVATRKHINWSTLSSLKGCEFFLDQNIVNKQLKRCLSVSGCSKGNPYYDLCQIYGKSLGSYKNYHCYKCEASSKGFKNQLITDSCTSDCNKNCPSYDETALLFAFTMSSNGSHMDIINFRQLFPIRTFLNIPLSYKLPVGENFEQYLCRGRRTKCCDCSETCMQRKQCCIDKFWNETNPVPYNSYLDLFVQKSKHFKDYSCEPVLPYASSIGHTSEYRLMVKSCHQAFNGIEKIECISPSNSLQPNFLPVLGSDGYVYSNSYCAICNFLKDFQVINITADCADIWPPAPNEFRKLYQNSSATLNLQRNFQGCVFKSSVSIPCKTGSKWNKPCPYGSPDYDLCKSYSGKMKSVANYHCWRCHNFLANTTFPPIVNCDPFKCPAGDCLVVVQPPPYLPWSFLVSFSETTKFQVRGFGTKTLCQNGTTYDIESSTCVQYLCSNLYHQIAGKCVLKTPAVPKVITPIVLEPNFDNCIAAQKSVFFFILERNTSINELEIISNFHAVTNITLTLKTLGKSLIKIANCTITEDMLDTIMHTPLENVFLHGIKKLIIAKKLKTELTQRYGFDLSRIFSHKICAKPILNDARNVTVSPTCDIVQNNFSTQLKDVSMWIEITNAKRSRLYSTCEILHLHSDCPLKPLINNVTVNKSNFLIHKTQNGETHYRPEDYLPLKTGFGVCISSPTRHAITYIWLKDLYEVEHYISIVGTSISVLCYIWIISTFIGFKELRTLPGLNTLGMCSSLLFADVLFLLTMKAKESYTFCLTVAVLLHWSLLLSFLWSILIAYDLVVKFGTFKVSSRENNVRKFLPRCILALLISTVIVVITVSLDQGSNVDVGYGINRICWINYLHARIAAYIVPISLAFLITLCSLSYTMYKIHHELKVNEKVLKTGSFRKLKTLKIALKLTIILGLSEGIGFIQIVKSDLSERELAINASFGFVYSLFRSLRGVMLWLVYILGANAFSMYKKRIQSFRRKHAEESTHLDTKSTGLNSSNNEINGASVADSRL